MELFFSEDIKGNTAKLSAEEGRHCTKVMRHRVGDIVHFVDGNGGLYYGKIVDFATDGVTLDIMEYIRDYESRSYHLHIAVALTKNIERYEWFLEKAVELGVDEITPLTGEHSERVSFRQERGRKIILSAMKQSLKAKLPVLHPVKRVLDFIGEHTEDETTLKLFGHCREGERSSFIGTLRKECRENPSRILMMIGPEGDFSLEEISSAVSAGFIPVQMGDSRMRVETAAVVAVSGIYLMFNNF